MINIISKPLEFDYELKKKLIDKWLISICKDNIQSLCDSIYPKFQKYIQGLSQDDILRFSAECT